MRLMRSSILLCSFFATVFAANIQLTQFPSEGAQPGVPTNIEWSGGDGISTITIMLVQGTVANYKNISTVLQRNTQATSFSWTPGALPDGNDYMLEIIQGSEVSYTAPFSISATTPVSVTTVPGSASSTQIVVPPLSPNPLSPIPVPLTTPITISSGIVVPPLSPVTTGTNPGGPISIETTPASTSTVVVSVASITANSTTGIIMTSGAPSVTATGTGTGSSASASPTSGAVGLGSSFALVMATLFSAFILA